MLAHYEVEEPNVENGPFNSLLFSLAEATGRGAWFSRFEKLALSVFELPRSPEGAWLHPRGQFGDGHAVLLDSFQEEAARLVKLAKRYRLTGEEGRAGELEKEAVVQFRIHRRILRNPATGLWHNGRGWREEDSMALSPGAWSRGHGWLLRGLVSCLEVLPEGAARVQIASLFLETVDTLLPLRNPNGCWPVLLHRAGTGSPTETSGSAMMASALLKAERLRIPLPKGAAAAAGECVSRLAHDCLSETGEVSRVCPVRGRCKTRPHIRIPGAGTMARTGRTPCSRPWGNGRDGQVTISLFSHRDSSPVSGFDKLTPGSWQGLGSGRPVRSSSFTRLPPQASADAAAGAFVPQPGR